MFKNAHWLWRIGALCISSVQAEEAAKLDLDYCLEAAMEHNRELIQARGKIRQEESNGVMVHSRFMPSLDLRSNYNASRTEAQGKTEDHVASHLRFSQRLFEFGPELAHDVQQRENLRKAIYAYQDQVYRVLSQVWQTFHLILLQERQIATRHRSRQDFQEDYERKQARFERRLAGEEEVLSAYLNVLNEELAINNLEREQFNDEMTLLRLIGQPIGLHLRLSSAHVNFTLEPEQAVKLALENSVPIALAAWRLEEQQRILREIDWEYSPDLSFGTGVEDGRRNAKVSLDRDGGTWGMDLSSELQLREEQPEDPAFSDETRWFAQVEARIPIFEGGLRLGLERREKARLHQIEVELGDLRASAELQVRQAYQSMLEAEGRQRIQQERVRIARRRLEINQILMDKGQADESKLEQLRSQFFQAQDVLFQNQVTYIIQQATLRRFMGYFK